MKYSIAQIRQWADEGQAISARLALDLLKDNLEYRSLLVQAIEIISKEDPVLLRNMNMAKLKTWNLKAQEFISRSPREP